MKTKKNQERWMITGVAGFLGNHVAEKLLEQGAKVVGIDNMSWGLEKNVRPFKEHENFTFEKKDIRELDQMKESVQNFQPDYIVHLAALHFIPDALKNPSLATSINVHGTQVILEASRQAAIKSFWYASTGDVYKPSEEAHKENHQTLPFNIYGMTKYLGEQLIELESCENRPEVGFVLGRLFNLVGPRETNPHIMPEIIKQLKEHPEYLELGNTWPLRDFVPITDAAQAIIEMSQKAHKGINAYNVATGQSQSVDTIIDIIKELMNKDIELRKDPARVRKVERAKLSCSVDKLKEFIGWAPTANLKEVTHQLLKEEGLV